MPVWIKLFNIIDSKILLLISFAIMIAAKKYLPILIGNWFLYYDRIFTTYLFYWILCCAAGLNYNSFKNFVSKTLPFSWRAAFAIIASANIYFSLQSFCIMAGLYHFRKSACFILYIGYTFYIWLFYNTVK